MCEGFLILEPGQEALEKPWVFIQVLYKSLMLWGYQGFSIRFLHIKEKEAGAR